MRQVTRVSDDQQNYDSYIHLRPMKASSVLVMVYGNN